VVKIFVFIALIIMIGLIATCALQLKPAAFGTDVAMVAATASIPPGPEGALIRYGQNIFVHTPQFAGKYISAKMSCAACHPGGGTEPHANSLLGVYAKFPQWNQRSRRFIALQDRIAECFLRSSNGRPPAYESREMIAIVAYMAWLSRGAKVGEGFPNQGLISIHPAHQPDVRAGERIYDSVCMRCHGANGAGYADRYPPVWGPWSFNDGAGMNRLSKMAPFVKYAMPADNPNTLTAQDAYDVSAFVLSHPRPHFKSRKPVSFPDHPAGYF